MPSPRILIGSASVLAVLCLGACSSDDGGAASDGGAPSASAASDAPGDAGTATGADVEEALEAQLTDETVDVPSADGSTSIADFAAGTSGQELAAPDELAQILALVGTDADGYITADAVVVQASEADASLWCQTAARLGTDTYALIPVLADGTGVGCS